MMRWGLVALLAVGCVADLRGSDLDASGTLGTGTGGGGACGDEASAQAFELVNAGPSTVFVQASGFPGTSSLGLVQDGEAIRFPDCGVCSCDDCPGCAVCVGFPTTVRALVPGERFAMAWDGWDAPVLPVGDPGNACPTDACQLRCAAAESDTTAAVTWSTWFSTIDAPNLWRQGGAQASTVYAHPTPGVVEIEVTGPPAPTVTPSLSADGGGQAPFEAAHVVASYNPSDATGGIEVAALTADDRYLGIFVAPEVGTHSLTFDTLWRHAVVGVQGMTQSEKSGTGTVTLDTLDADAVTGSFAIELADGTFSGTFAAPFAAAI